MLRLKQAVLGSRGKLFATILLTLFISVVIAGNNAYANGCVAPPSGMVSWWGGDGNADDSVGTNHGTLMNGATFTPGMVGQAFSFDGVDDYVKVPHSDSLNLSTGHTVDMWVKLNQVLEDTILVNKWVNGQEDKGLAIGDDGKIVYWLYGGGYSYATVTSTSNLTAGVWYHIAATYDGTNAKIYINGVLDATEPASITVVNSSGNLYFGNNPDRLIYEPGRPYFSGLMDEIEWLNRALSAEEIAAIYNAGSAGKCLSLSPVSVPTMTEWGMIIFMVLAGLGGGYYLRKREMVN